MITLQTPIIRGSGQDMLYTPRAIVEMVYSKGTPQYSRSQITDISDYIIRCGGATTINTAILAAQILHETKYFQFTGDVKPEQYNFAGLGAVGGGAPGHSFENYKVGVEAVCIHHLTYVYGPVAQWDNYFKYTPSIEKEDPRYDALIASGRAGTVKVLGDYGNGNWATDPNYAPAIMNLANQLLALQQEGTSDMPDNIHVVIAAGHHNLQGGNDIEINIVDDITERVYYHLERQQDVTVTSLTPDGPDDDDLPGDGQANQRIFDLWRNGTKDLPSPPTLCIEFHTEGVSNPEVRGAFAIYPDWGTDIDSDVRDTLGPAIVNEIVSSTPITRRGDGTMSEQGTAVGRGGDRLGMFSATAPLASSTERMILECGAHSNPEERVWLQNSGHADALAQAVVRAIMQYYGLPYSYPGEIEGDTTPRYFPETGSRIMLGFKDFWELLEGEGVVWGVLGFPISDEFPTTPYRSLWSRDVTSFQFFERGVLVYGPKGDVRVGTLSDQIELLITYPDVITNRDQVNIALELLGSPETSSKRRLVGSTENGLVKW